MSLIFKKTDFIGQKSARNSRFFTKRSENQDIVAPFTRYLNSKKNKKDIKGPLMYVFFDNTQKKTKNVLKLFLNYAK